jgi:hypothetical protein
MKASKPSKEAANIAVNPSLRLPPVSFLLPPSDLIIIMLQGPLQTQ